MTKSPMSILTALIIISLSIACTAQEEARLTIRAMLVDDALDLKPVPRLALQITRLDSATAESSSVTTSFSGVAEVSLPPGTYQIRSTRLISFKGALYRWEETVELVSGVDTTIELSNDNALIEGNVSGQTTQFVASDLYNRFKGGVMTLEGEAADGSAFLVDSSGLIVTNQHVTSESRFFSVELEDGTRYAAKLIYSDALEDIAILRINPEVASRLPVLSLSDDSPKHIVAKNGEPVYAIGSPLNQSVIITSGIVSKVEEGVIISDVMIDHGNSGGPLLNAKGQVIGVNTFGEGRGVSGIIRVWKVFPVLEEARNRANSMSIPSAEPLPNYPENMFPVDAIAMKVLSKDFKITDYRISTSKFWVYLLTPPALAYFQNAERIEAARGRQKNRKKKKVTSEDTFSPTNLVANWAQYVGHYKPIVKVLIVPKTKATFGSSLASAFVGSSVVQYKYAGDFDDITLYRGDTVSPHIKMGRSADITVFAGIQGHMNDAAYQGWVDYFPDSFRPPSYAMKEKNSSPASRNTSNSQRSSQSDKSLQVYFHIVNELKPDKTIKVRVPTTMLNRIWEDFSPLRVPAEKVE